MFNINQAEKDALSSVNTLIAIRTLELKSELRDEFAALRERTNARFDALAAEFNVEIDDTEV